MKIKNLIAICIVIVALFSVTVMADDSIKVRLDGKEIVFDVQPTIKDGSTLVPVRAIFEALEASVEWDDVTRTVISTKGNTTIKMPIDSKTMYVNGKSVTLNYPAIIVGGRTLVPVRAISEAYGCQVGWDGKSKIVSIINDKANFTMLYAPENRARATANSEVNAYLNVGWYRDQALTDNTTAEQIYNKLKTRADANAFSCAETVVRNLHKNPSTVNILDREIIDHDNYLRYIVKIRATGANAAGGYVTDDFYIMLRINPAIDGNFEYYTGSILGYEYRYLDKDKQAFGWGTEPDDFYIATLPKKAEVVSIRRIIAYPEKYVDKYVKIETDLVIADNNLSNKYFYCYQSTGGGKYDYDTSANIKVYYNHVENLDECVMLNEDYQKCEVTGYVRTYSNSTDVYIDADVIKIK